MWREPIDDDLDMDTLPSRRCPSESKTPTNMKPFFSLAFMVGGILLSIVVSAIGIVVLATIVVLFKYIFG